MEFQDGGGSRGGEMQVVMKNEFSFRQYILLIRNVFACGLRVVGR